jgi:predicted secreted Zn-dependent protease
MRWHRFFVTFLPSAVLLCWFPYGAAARPQITLTERYYPVRGTTGLELIEEMDRIGPKQGFMSHAIAQTVYSLQYGADYSASGGVCRVKKTRVKLDITQIFPKLVDRPSPSLARRWKRFMAGVRRHEDTHVRIARDLAHVSERTILRTVTRDDPNCRRMRALLKRTIRGIYADYDARQNAFDRKEHRRGGHIDRLVMALVDGERQ